MKFFNYIYHFALLALLFSLSGCLTPEERAEVYGHDTASALQSQNVVNEEANLTEDNQQPVHQPPKAAPTTVVTTNAMAPVAGLRRAEDGSDVPIASPGLVDCGVDKVAHLQGQALASLRSMKFKQQIRINLSGRYITEDFKPFRLNFDVTEQGIIGRLWCG